MAGEGAKSGLRGAPSKAGRSRRTHLRRERPSPLRWLRGERSAGPVGTPVSVAVLFALVCGLVAVWARSQPLVAVGRVMNQTALVRTPLRILDEGEAEQRREQARRSAPRVYTLNATALDSLRASLTTLPETLASVPTPAGVVPEVRERFGITDETFHAVRALVSGGVVDPAWSLSATRFIEELHTRPLLDAKTYQREFLESRSDRIELRAGSAASTVPRESAVSLGDAHLREVIDALAAAAGFQGALRPLVVRRVLHDPQPTYLFDQAATTESQNRAAGAVRAGYADIPVGQPIFQRGKELTDDEWRLYAAEMKAFNATERWRVWVRRASVFAAVGAITLAISGYLAMFCPRVRQNPARVAALALLLGGALGLACWATVTDPRLLYLAAVAPTVFVAVILVVAYDQRVALALSVLHATLVCVALDQPIGLFAITITGVSVAVWHLRELRDRRTLVRMSVYVGAAVGAGAMLVGLLDRPIVPESLRETAWDAALAAGGGLLVGGVTLFILPTVERLFDITTGMTLIELRDPKHPLLRELQQRAPGTYNHSLNVAAIAEAAADAIGADGLLTYVGALYHDVGKMNKPDYFVENQSGSINRHDKLSPAMSLLVIVGHVKDGMELAREFDLPRSVQHFVEAHHGTTLVEYFYHRAVRKAEEEGSRGGDSPEPAEIEYRYPGPRPRTKECAILMLADAVESATRSLSEPTPGRIESLVRDLANKRLLDGQFDECDLSLRELNQIVESVNRSVASIFHGRVVYPEAVAGRSSG